MAIRRTEPPGQLSDLAMGQRNFWLYTADGALFFAAIAFLEPTTVLPAFVVALTDSSVLIGLVTTVRSGGWLLPQLLAANYIEQRAEKKPALLRYGLISRAAVAGLALLAYWGGAFGAAFVLALFFCLFLTFNVCEGISTVAWIDLLAKTVPPNRRGALFSAMQFSGNLLGIGAGVLVKVVLDNRNLPFPRNYGWLFMLGAAIYALEYAALYSLQEKRGGEAAGERTLLEYLRGMPGLFRRSPPFRRAAAIRVLLGFNNLVLPFYAVYGQKSLHLGAGSIGTFLLLQTAGSMAGSLYCGRISDRRGNRAVIILAAIATFAVPAVALLTLLLLRTGATGIAYLYSALFGLIGLSNSGVMIGFTNYVLEAVNEKERPSYYGLLNSLTALTTLLPLAGGVLIEATSFAAAAAAALLCLGSAVALSLRLPEPREMDSPWAVAGESCN